MLMLSMLNFKIDFKEFCKILKFTIKKIFKKGEFYEIP